MRRAATEALGRAGPRRRRRFCLALARDERVEAGGAPGRLPRRWAGSGRAEEAAEILLALARMSGWRPGCAGRMPRRWAALGRAEEAAESLALARDEQVEAGVRRAAAEALGRLGPGPRTRWPWRGMSGWRPGCARRLPRRWANWCGRGGGGDSPGPGAG